MTVRYCLPIIEPQKARVLELIKTYENDYDLFEVWLDYIDDLEISFVLELERVLGDKGILLLRRRELQVAKLSAEKRREIISKLEGRIYLDLDIRAQIEEINFIKSLPRSLPLIISYHNYELTPAWEDLWGIVKEMISLCPSILKVSTFCRMEHEALRLLDLLLTLRAEGQRSIVLGMGPNGAITRVFGSLWGNEFVFAPSSRDKASAPGQLTRTELEGVFQALGVEGGRK